MRSLIRTLVLASLLSASAGRTEAADAFLTITSPGKTMTFTAAEWAALPRTEIKAVEPHEKKERVYAGVAMRDLLTRASAPLGDKLRGPALVLGVVVRCKDNYTVLYALAEFDANFSSRTILLADRDDGQALPVSAAPLRLVAPGDARGARWARMVNSIEIVPLASKP